MGGVRGDCAAHSGNGARAVNDDSYEILLNLFEGRDVRDSLRVAARVILLLAGRADDSALEAALREAESPPPTRVRPRDILHYGYFRSSADYRVRIALRLKRAEFERAFVNLRKGEHCGDSFRRVNPAGLVPAIVRNGEGGEGGLLTQSLAIIEYLNDILPRPDLLPGGAWERAQVRAAAMDAACDIHPLCNLRALNKLRERFGADDAAVREWIAEWIGAGLGAMEARLAAAPPRGKLMFGDIPTLAEVCLVPQIYNANRFGMDLSPFPRVMRIHDVCMKNRAFREAAPESQPDCNI